MTTGVSGKHFWKQGYVNSILGDEQILIEMQTMDWAGKVSTWTRMKRGMSISPDSCTTNEETQLNGFSWKGNLLAWKLSSVCRRHLDVHAYIMSPEAGWLLLLLASLSLGAHHFHPWTVFPRVRVINLGLFLSNLSEPWDFSFPRDLTESHAHLQIYPCD